MEVTGRISKALEKRTGTSSNGETWVAQEYIFEYFFSPMDSFPSSILFNVFGELKINSLNLQEGKEYTVHLKSKVKEYNGKYFNQVGCINATPVAKNEHANISNPSDLI